ncbi:MAG: hypothetical protein ACP5LG_07075 [Conexivisphaera sp.]
MDARITSSPSIVRHLSDRGYSPHQYIYGIHLLRRYGYLVSEGRGAYTVNPKLYYVDPAWSIRVNPPERPREPHLDLLLIVLSGDRTPMDAFLRLYAGAWDPKALYMRARRELLRYGYIEDRYGNRYYYPGSRMRSLYNTLLLNNCMI